MRTIKASEFKAKCLKVMDEVAASISYLAGDDSALESALDRLLGDPALRLVMGGAAARHAREFDWDRIAAAWADGLEGAASRARRLGSRHRGGGSLTPA